MHLGLIVLFVIIGLIAGTLGSLVGFGGGFIIVPLVSLFLTLPARIIAGTSTAVIIVNSLISTYIYHRQKRIDVKSGLIFAVASIPGSFLGADLDKYLSIHTFDRLFGTLLLIATVLLIFRPKKASRSILAKTSSRTLVDSEGNTHEWAFNLPVGVLFAFLMGFVASAFGVGGGTIMVPVMILLLGFPPHIAAATSMLMVFISSIVGTISHAIQGDINWGYMLCLSIGAWFGGQLGPRIAAKLSGPWLIRTLAVLLVVTALRLIL